jgi:translation initiation factor 2B subunit (eIF-2B alpha/beta/delta family)
METIEELKEKLKLYEQNGAAKAAYSINRKLNELADMLNKTNVANIDIADAKDKSFERLKTAWGEMASLGEAYKTLAASAGITGDEAVDVEKKPFVSTIAETRR